MAGTTADIHDSRSLRQSTYQLLSSQSNYTIFSTQAFERDGEDFNNIESIHGQIHVSIGGNGGHMTYTPWSAFDPVFFLHHTFVPS